MEKPNGSRYPLLSVVTPAYNEQDNLRELYERLLPVLREIPGEWEWVIVDDHSSDATFGVISELAALDDRIHGFRLARNVGSHVALNCGLHHAAGDCAVVMAADLQDPPEVIGRLVDRWVSGAQVVWAVRAAREGERATTVGLARIYYWVMRAIVGMREVPSSGADFFLIDRRVIDGLKQFRETHVSMLILLAWMGFRQEYVYYEKRARLRGASGWTLKKKIKLAIDSVTAFSYVPIRLMTYVGIGVALVGFCYAAIVVINSLLGSPPSGWSSLMVVLLVIGGIQMIMMGVLGEYLWRTSDEARRRPMFLIEAVANQQGAADAGVWRGLPSAESVPHPTILRQQ